MSRKPLVIRDDGDLKAALDRAEALFGCINDSDEQQELAEIADAIKVYTDSMRVLRMLDRDPNETGEFASDD